ncbi:MAG: Rpp14/Pop5 family protein [Candidatus Methanofastidiosia archaeon]
MKFRMPKTMREKKRYIKVRMVGEAELSGEQLRRAVWQSAMSFFGEYGASKMNLWISSWDSEKMKGVLRCNILFVDDVIVSLKLIRNINGKKVNFVVEGVSGTIKSLKKC